MLSNVPETFTPLGLCLILAACGGSSSTDTPEPDDAITSTAVTIPFAGVFNSSNDTISCEADLSGLGTAGTSASLEDFRFYLHNIVLTTSQGRDLPLALEDSDFQNGEVALLDFQNRADKCAGDPKPTNAAVTGSLPLRAAERVTGLSFTVGVPENLNHQNTAAAASPLNVASMFWNWQGGYKFMRLDIAPQDGVIRTGVPDAPAWNFHLGSTSCQGDPEVGETVVCDRPNRVDIGFPRFDPDIQTVALDYSALIGLANVAADAGGASGCMSGPTDPECPGIVEALALDWDSGQMDMDPSASQTAFRLINTADL